TRRPVLLRTNLVEEDPAKLWSHYLLLVAVEEAFKNLKSLPCESRGRPRDPADLSPARGPHRGARLHRLPGLLSARYPGAAPACAGARADAAQCAGEVAAVQMIDVHLPTTDGRELVLTRYTEPEPELNLSLNKVKLKLPALTSPIQALLRI